MTNKKELQKKYVEIVKCLEEKEQLLQTIEDYHENNPIIGPVFDLYTQVYGTYDPLAKEAKEIYEQLHPQNTPMKFSLMETHVLMLRENEKQIEDLRKLIDGLNRYMSFVEPAEPELLRLENELKEKLFTLINTGTTLTKEHELQF